jgi:hypothetical protein
VHELWEQITNYSAIDQINAEREAVAIAGRPWDRQPNESPKAFEAFAIYRDMAYRRSLAAVGWKLHKSRTLLSRWRVPGFADRVG